MLDINVGTVIPLYTAIAAHFQETSQGKLVTIGARASQPAAAQHHVAYALSKEVLRHLTAIAQIGLGANGSAHILLPRTLDTPASRAAMPDAPSDSFTSLASITSIILDILDGQNKETVIEC
jgi:NAD(P)-dependent dehydrogenase (short-subunit alcohol dehydrogenase family)